MFDEEKTPSSPITFHEEGKEWRQSPITFEEDRINSENNYAITRLTSNGKYVRGNMLFYKFNGVEIYTEINNIILVDVINRCVFIKKHSEVIEQVAPKNPEQKQYIILYCFELGEEEESDDTYIWESYIGRSYAYKALLCHLSVIDIDKSLVLVDNVALKDSLSVRKFLEYLKNAGLVPEDDFDLSDYYEEV